MEMRYASSPGDVRYYSTERIRQEFLVQNLFLKDQICLVQSSIDRMAIGTAVPCENSLILNAEKDTDTDYFLEGRETGIINIGGEGRIIVDGIEYRLSHLDGMYVGKGAKEIVFLSEESSDPAKFYFNAVPAHKKLPNVKINLDGNEAQGAVTISRENKVELGSQAECNQRSIIKYILPGQVESCQLVMGMTILEEGSVWNTMPCHTHVRRMEVYLYFNMEKDALVMHFMGEPEETKHIIVRNEEAVISPEWSIHTGCGTGRYAFIWGMAGENKDFTDMEQVTYTVLR